VAIINDKALENSTVIAINKGLPTATDRLEQIRINTSLNP
jgi:hypothetical protein